MNNKIVVKCPKCRKSFPYSESKYRPFCSERCKQIDLGHWFSETYTLPSKEKLSDEDIDSVLRERSKGNDEEY